MYYLKKMKKNISSKVIILNSNIMKVEKRVSTIASHGYGLFALHDIKKDSIIVEFKGKLNKRGETSSNRSNIYFSDEAVLECPLNDLASFANDAIMFTGERRLLMESLTSREPFYKKYPGTNINADIYLNNDKHRAFLKSTMDIKKGDEIFCHYGFEYWFKIEISKIGFPQEDYIEKNGFPEKIFEYPAFVAYLYEFYPGIAKIDVKPFKKFYDIIIAFNDGKKLLLPMTNYAELISRVNPNDVKENDGKYFQ